MSASRDARAEVYTDISAIIGPVSCLACKGAAVQRVADVCSPSFHIGETRAGVVASFPGGHLQDAFAMPRHPGRAPSIKVHRWFLAAGLTLPITAGLFLWNRTAGAASAALPIVFLAFGAIDYRNERNAMFTYKTAQAWYEQEIGFWNRLYYCHECGQVFLPNGRRSSSPDQWRRLMV